MPYIQPGNYNQWDTVPVAGGTSSIALKGRTLIEGLTLSVKYATTLTGAGSGVRAISVPVKRIIIRNGSKIIQVIKGTDAIRKALIMDQVPLASMVTAASAAAVATYSALEAHIPIYFRHPHADPTKASKLSLAPWVYKDLTITVEWGTVADLFTDGGTLAGTIAFTANEQRVIQHSVGGLVIPDYKYLAAVQKTAIETYVETTQAAAASLALERILQPNDDIRAIMLVAELTSTGEPTNTIVNTVTLKANRSDVLYDAIPWQSIRAKNAKDYGATLPTGVAILDFADDGDTDSIFEGSKGGIDLLSLFYDTAAVAGTIRAHEMLIGRPNVFANANT